MKTKLWAVSLVVLCTLFTSSAQILYKKGAEKLGLNLISIITNWNLIFGIVLYVMGAVLLIVAFRGGDVTVLYPIITTSFVWVTLGSMYFFGETISFLRWIGVFLIIVGIIVINLGSEDKKISEFTEAI